MEALDDFINRSANCELKIVSDGGSVLFLR
jgi:hypothetical protein